MTILPIKTDTFWESLWDRLGHCGLRFFASETADETRILPIKRYPFWESRLDKELASYQAGT
jgi:hypothetical protein